MWELLKVHLHAHKNIVPRDVSEKKAKLPMTIQESLSVGQLMHKARIRIGRSVWEYCVEFVMVHQFLLRRGLVDSAAAALERLESRCFVRINLIRS